MKLNLQNCLDQLHLWSNKWLMEINLKKTEVMIFQKHRSKTPQNVNFLLGNEEIETTHEYNYLRVKLTPNTNFIGCDYLTGSRSNSNFKESIYMSCHNSKYVVGMLWLQLGLLLEL